MNDHRLLPDDPKLTAYALGELAGDERAAVESALRENPALRIAVEEIRAASKQLEAAFATEEMTAASPVDSGENVIPFQSRAAFAGAASPPPRSRRRFAKRKGKAPVQATGATNGAAYSTPKGSSKLVRFPQFYFIVGGAAAACFAVVVALYERPAPAARIVAERQSPPHIALAGSSPEMPTVPPTETAQPRAAAETSAPVSVASAETTSVATDAIAPVGPLVSERATTVAGRGAPTLSEATSPGSFIPGNLSLAAAAVSRGGNEQLSEKPAGRVAADATSAASAIAGVATTANSASPASTGLQPGRSESLNGTSIAPDEFETARVVSAQTSAAAVTTATRGQEPDVRESAWEPTPASTPITFNAPPISVSETTIAGTGIGTMVAGRSILGANSSLTATPGSSETVKLEAFMVSADRGTGFAGLSQGQGTVAGTRAWTERDHLPHAPPGARFGSRREAALPVRDNDFVSVAVDASSQFSSDVDTASYANIRRMIVGQGSKPTREAVRIEEMLNYFPYKYAAPKGDQPFAATLEVADAPWAAGHRLVRIGLKAREVPVAKRAAANLVFLIDVSSSMDQPNKLPLVKQSLRLLLAQLRPDDRVAIVTYGGNSGLALPPTRVAQGREIRYAVESLTPGRASNGTAGIQLAYEVAQANFTTDTINRVILCTDGDFDVGIAGENELVEFVEQKARSGVFLTVLGFGMTNYKQDATLEKLATKGNGSYGYIDTRREAEKLLVEQVNGTLVTVAKDVKLEVVFNPARVSKYRLIGYENRVLRREDFNDDSVNAGEVGAGHTITALYEIVPRGVADKSSSSDGFEETNYGASGAASSRLAMPEGKRSLRTDELLSVKVRYKKPDSFLSFPRTLDFRLADTPKAFANATADFRFAAAVAQFGMILRDSPHRGTATIGDVTAWAAAAATNPSDDPGGYRNEFIDLVLKTQVLME